MPSNWRRAILKVLHPPGRAAGLGGSVGPSAMTGAAGIFPSIAVIAEDARSDQSRLVAQRASSTARTDEIEPDPAVFKLDGGSAEPSPSAHDDPAHGSLEDGDEIALDVCIHTNGCAKRQEIIGNGPVGCCPSQMEIAYGLVASAAPGREIVEQEAPMASTPR